MATGANGTAARTPGFIDVRSMNSALAETQRPGSQDAVVVQFKDGGGVRTHQSMLVRGS